MWFVPAVPKVHENVELPEPATLVGDKEHEVLLVVRAITPENPLRPVTVIVEVPAEPAFTVTLVGAALMVKSWRTNVTVVP